MKLGGNTVVYSSRPIFRGEGFLYFSSFLMNLWWGFEYKIKSRECFCRL